MELFRTLVGSRLYGLEGPGSDYDYRGVHLTPLPELLLARGTKNSQEKYEHEDVTLYEGNHFVRLLMGGNPTMTEMVYSLELNQPELLEELGLTKLLDSAAVMRSTQGYIKGALAKPSHKGMACGALYVGLYHHLFGGESMNYWKALARMNRQGEWLTSTDEQLRNFLEESDWYKQAADYGHAHHLLKYWYA